MLIRLVHARNAAIHKPVERIHHWKSLVPRLFINIQYLHLSVGSRKGLGVQPIPENAMGLTDTPQWRKRLLCLSSAHICHVW